MLKVVNSILQQLKVSNMYISVLRYKLSYRINYYTSTVKGIEINK